MLARIIALEGIDQSGKATQTRLLADRLRRAGFRVSTISFPMYQSSAGRLIHRFLNGQRGFPPEAVHMLYSLNRWENQPRVQKLAHEKDFLIADRYSPSNLAYGVSRGLNLNWLRALDRGLPEADLVIILDTSVPASFARKSSDRDVHERDRRLLRKVRRNYMILARKLGWRTVDATRPVEETARAVWSIVQRRFSLSPRKK